MNYINNIRRLKPITILHLADLHLVVSEDNPGSNPDNVLVSPPITFQTLVNAANHLDVDLVLITGDFFDTYHPSKELISYAQEQFSRLRPPAIMIPGNHDCLGYSGTYLEPEWEGTATLEISNTTPLPAKIYANEGIAQVLFFQSDEPCETSYADKKGKYQSQKVVTLPKI